MGPKAKPNPKSSSSAKQQHPSPSKASDSASTASKSSAEVQPAVKPAQKKAAVSQYKKGQANRATSKEGSVASSASNAYSRESGSSLGHVEGFTGEVVRLNKRRYGVAITWDPLDPNDPVDLDLQAIIIDDRGNIVDAVYYNNLSAMRGAVSHTGDEVTGDANEFDEMIWTVFPKLPQQVKMVLFVVAASGDSSLRDATNGMIHILQDSYGQTVTRWKIEQSRADVDVIAMMEKSSSGKWSLYQVDEPAEHGEHFLDILEPTIGDIIRRRIDKAPKFQRVTFQMEKGAAVDLPKDALKRLRFAVEANVKYDVKKSIDLDVSAVFTDDKGKSLGACSCEKLKLWGFQHSGDGDADEDLNVDLLQVPSKVHQVFIVVDLYSSSKHVSFNDMDDASCSVSDQDCKTLANFSLKGEVESDLSGLIICRLLRGSSKRWEIQAVGRFCHGPTWKEALPAIQQLYAEAEQAAKDAAHVGNRRNKGKRQVWRGTAPTVSAGGSYIEPAPEDEEKQPSEKPGDSKIEVGDDDAAAGAPKGDESWKLGRPRRATRRKTGTPVVPWTDVVESGAIPEPEQAEVAGQETSTMNNEDSFIVQLQESELVRDPKANCISRCSWSCMPSDEDAVYSFSI